MTSFRRTFAVAALTLAGAPAAAHAAVPHDVAPGETLWGLAAAQNMTTRAFAAANGLSPDARLIAGTVVTHPTVDEAASALTTAAPAAGVSPSGGTTVAPSTSTAPGGYTVRPGDTLSGLAVASGMSVADFAALNGLAIDGPLLIGTVVKRSGGASAPAPAAAAPAATPPAAAAAPGRVTSGDIKQVAGEHGVSGSLASAIAWQESGFNNAMVSSTNARGVMQVMPGTWDWVQKNLSSTQLNPDSPTDNVRAGVLYLNSLLRSSGGDAATAVASYYQGPNSVRKIGMLPETRRYVDNVFALQGRFGG